MMAVTINRARRGKKVGDFRFQTRFAERQQAQGDTNGLTS